MQSKPFQLFGSQWRHNWRDGVYRSLNCLFRRRSKKISKLRDTGLCEGNHRWSVDSPHKGPVRRKMFPFDDVIIVKRQLPMSTCFILRLINVIWLHRTWPSLVHVNNRHLFGAKPSLELIMGNCELYPENDLQSESNYKRVLQQNALEMSSNWCKGNITDNSVVLISETYLGIQWKDGRYGWNKMLRRKII